MVNEVGYIICLGMERKGKEGKTQQKQNNEQKKREKKKQRGPVGDVKKSGGSLIYTRLTRTTRSVSNA